MDSFRLRNVSVIALMGVVFALGCGAVVAFAQDAGAPPPPPPSGGESFSGSQPSPPPPSGGRDFGGDHSFGGSQPPPPPPSGGGDFGGGYQPQGDFNRMPPPPRGDFGGGYREPPQGGFGGERMPPPGGQYQQNYQQEYNRQYGEEAQRQMEQKGRDMRQQYGGDERRMMQSGGQRGRMQNGGGPRGEFGGSGDESRMMQYGDRGQGGGFEDHGYEEGGYGDEGFGGGGGEEDDFEAREAEQQERMLSEMKRNLRGMEQGLKMIKNMADKLAKQGVSIPSEYATLVSDLTTALGVVKNATEFTDEVESAMSVIMERGEELRDAGPRLGALSQWPKTLKQAEAQVKRLDTQFARVKKNKAATAYPDLVARVEAAVGAVRSAFAQAKSEASGGDIEGAMETLRDGVFEATEDAYDALRVLDNIANMSRMVKQAEKEIARYEKEAARYEKQKKDVSTLRNLIALMKNKLAEVRGVMSSGDVDHDDLFEVMSAAEEIRNDADAELQHLRGRPSASERPLQNSSAERAGASIGKALESLRQ